MTNPYVTGTVLEVSGGELLVDWFLFVKTDPQRAQ
jgi:hypothetical protein